MADTEVYEVKAEVQSFGEKAYVTRVSLESGINRYAQCYLQYPPPDAEDAENKAVALTSADVTKKLGEMQQKAFEDRSSPDSEVALKVEGSGGTKVNVKLKGYGLAPSYAFSPYHVSIGASVLDEFAAIDVARFGIYGATWQDDNTGQYNTYGDTLEDCGWDIPQCLYKMAEDMTKNGLSSAAFESDNLPDLDKQTKQAQHKLNTRVLPLLKKLCENSTKFGWKDSLSKLSTHIQTSVDAEIRRCLHSHLVSSSGSFLTTLLDICDEFQCVLVCEVSNDGMKYDMRSRQEIMKDPEDLTLPIQALNASAAAGAGIFPTRFVAVTRPGYVDMNLGTTVQFLACPKKNMEAGGTALPVAPPSWMRDIQNDNSKASNSGKPAKRKGCEKTEKGEIKEETNEQLEGIASESEDIMKEWAENCFAWNALGSSQVTIQAPMIVEVKSGKRYTVKNENGDTLFTGFAADVSYELQTGSGSNNSATTDIEFTHVEFGSFKLPTD